MSVGIRHGCSRRDGQPPGCIILIPETGLKVRQSWLGRGWGGCERLTGVLPHVICAGIALVRRHLALRCTYAVEAEA